MAWGPVAWGKQDVGSSSPSRPVYSLPSSGPLPTSPTPRQASLPVERKCQIQKMHTKVFLLSPISSNTCVLVESRGTA